jgi:hypothetical protein
LAGVGVWGRKGHREGGRGGGGVKLMRRVVGRPAGMRVSEVELKVVESRGKERVVEREERGGEEEESG